MTEKEIQNYIWKNKQNWIDLLSPINFPKKIEIENPSHITPSQAIFNMIVTNYEDHFNSLFDLELIGCEVPLKKDSDSTIRADFLGVLQGRNGLTVIELKKSRQTERQAYTELLAYGSHLKTIFSPMSKIDIGYVLISPMEERIVREATINSILYDKNYVIALIPKWKKNDINSLTLEPWIPTFEEINNLTTSCFSGSNFNIFKVTWDALQGDWSPEKNEDDPDQDMIDKMNTVSAYAAQLMEAKGIHGFVYTMQNWSEIKNLGHLINAIVIGGINPYKATKNRVLTTKHNLTQKQADEISIDYFDIYQIIPELKREQILEDKYEPNYLSDLSMSWDNEIAGIGFDIVKTLTKSIDKKWIETSHGGFNWENYQNSMEDSYCHLFEMRVTGLMRELFFEYSKLDYDFIRENGANKHEQYWGGDIPNYLVDISTNQYYLRNFIQRLFNPYFEYMDNIEGDDDDDDIC